MPRERSVASATAAKTMIMTAAAARRSLLFVLVSLATLNERPMSLRRRRRRRGGRVACRPPGGRGRSAVGRAVGRPSAGRSAGRPSVLLFSRHDAKVIIHRIKTRSVGAMSITTVQRYSNLGRPHRGISLQLKTKHDLAMRARGHARARGISDDGEGWLKPSPIADGSNADKIGLMTESAADARRDVVVVRSSVVMTQAGPPSLEPGDRSLASTDALMQ